MPRIITSVGKAVLGVKDVAGGRGVDVFRSISVCSEPVGIVIQSFQEIGCKRLLIEIKTIEPGSCKLVEFSCALLYQGYPSFSSSSKFQYNEFMADEKKPHGVIAAAVTPLNQDGSLALDDWLLLLEYLRGRGCHGALLLGTTGEGPSFSPTERLEIVKAIQPFRSANPGFDVLVGTGTPSLDETVFLNRAVFKLGGRP